MLSRPPERNPPSPSGGEKLRWRKESFPWRHHPQDTDRSPQHELEQESQVEDHLAAEANMVILDTLENVVQVCECSVPSRYLFPFSNCPFNQGPSCIWGVTQRITPKKWSGRCSVFLSGVDDSWPPSRTTVSGVPCVASCPRLQPVHHHPHQHV